jgi:hypothetical protein
MTSRYAILELACDMNLDLWIHSCCARVRHYQWANFDRELGCGLVLLTRQSYYVTIAISVPAMCWEAVFDILLFDHPSHRKCVNVVLKKSLRPLRFNITKSGTEIRAIGSSRLKVRDMTTKVLKRMLAVLMPEFLPKLVLLYEEQRWMYNVDKCMKPSLHLINVINCDTCYVVPSSVGTKDSGCSMLDH